MTTLKTHTGHDFAEMLNPIDSRMVGKVRTLTSVALESDSDIGFVFLLVTPFGKLLSSQEMNCYVRIVLIDLLLTYGVCHESHHYD